MCAESYLGQSHKTLHAARCRVGSILKIFGQSRLEDRRTSQVMSCSAFQGAGHRQSGRNLKEPSAASQTSRLRVRGTPPTTADQTGSSGGREEGTYIQTYTHACICSCAYIDAYAQAHSHTSHLVTYLLTLHTAGYICIALKSTELAQMQQANIL